jgi:hypothetical protein
METGAQNYTEASSHADPADVEDCQIKTS